MIKAGLTTKVIAAIMCISASAVSFHRSKIRKRLGQGKTRRAAASDPGAPSS